MNIEDDAFVNAELIELLKANAECGKLERINYSVSFLSSLILAMQIDLIVKGNDM